jgi:hypothetical protein
MVAVFVDTSSAVGTEVYRGPGARWDLRAQAALSKCRAALTRTKGWVSNMGLNAIFYVNSDVGWQVSSAVADMHQRIAGIFF